MNIFFENKIKSNQYLLNVLLGRKTQTTGVGKKDYNSRMDTVTISDAAREMSTRSVSAGRTHNTSVDSSIDLQGYIDAAKQSNADAIENAGNTINAKAVSYTSTGSAFRAALTEKYTKLVSEAKTHSNPENYIYQKYYDKGFEYYETNLNDTERQIAYNYEMQMYRNGKINGVNYQDSLFRGIEVNGDVVDNNKIQFERQVVNSQISNILQQSGINTSEIPESCEFTVDPYTYEISVDGVGQDLKTSMESALNVGENGKNLFYHIYKCSTQDGCNSTQVSSESYMKYQAYQQTYEYTELKLNELEEKDGTYYTSDGTDIKELIKNSVDESDTVPKDYKAQMKQWICGLISDISQKGWNNVPDMKLSILYGQNGLVDTKQSITFASDSEWLKGIIGSSWYSVI
jgi:hypothetical protein